MQPEFEPIPDASQAKKKGGRLKSSSDAKEREDDVTKVKEILSSCGRTN